MKLGAYGLGASFLSVLCTTWFIQLLGQPAEAESLEHAAMLLIVGSGALFGWWYALSVTVFGLWRVLDRPNHPVAGDSPHDRPGHHLSDGHAGGRRQARSQSKPSTVQALPSTLALFLSRWAPGVVRQAVVAAGTLAMVATPAQSAMAEVWTYSAGGTGLYSQAPTPSSGEEPRTDTLSWGEQVKDTNGEPAGPSTIDHALHGSEAPPGLSINQEPSASSDYQDAFGWNEPVPSAGPVELDTEQEPAQGIPETPRKGAGQNTGERTAQTHGTDTNAQSHPTEGQPTESSLRVASDNHSTSATSLGVGLERNPDIGTGGPFQSGLNISETPRRTDTESSTHTGSATGTSSSTYTVQPGDNLWRITERLLVGNAHSPARLMGAIEQLYQANRGLIGADPDIIHAGATLTIPWESPVAALTFTTSDSKGHRHE